MNNENLKPNALVKMDELDCYDWEHEDGLLIVAKIDDLDKEHGIYLYHAYNIDKKAWGGVASHQIILLDPSWEDAVAEFEGYSSIYGCGNKVRGIKKKKGDDIDE